MIATQRGPLASRASKPQFDTAVERHPVDLGEAPDLRASRRAEQRATFVSEYCAGGAPTVHHPDDPLIRLQLAAYPRCNTMV
jgi:hypothetical protein